jgi:hypothetical protein
MELLPDEDERERPLDQLTRLVLAAGADTFVAAPIVAPDDRAFPDRWTPDAAGVERLLRRVLGHAGLGALELELSIDAYAETEIQVDAQGRAQITGHRGTAAWFAGIRGRTCRFGVDVNGLADPGQLAGTLAHEAAHAYRHYHDLVARDPALEEQLTDLTTVYLGLGILTANASVRYRSDARGYRSTHGGYLSVQAMCWLLAAQVVARGEPPRGVARWLDTTQAACLRAACGLLDRDALIARLGLPLPALWPRPPAPPRRGLWARLFGRLRRD